MTAELRELLTAVRSGELDIDTAILAIRKQPFVDLGFARVDVHRRIRQGATEVIYGAGKKIGRAHV